MRDVAYLELITHLSLLKSEQNKYSKVAVAIILKKEANLVILSTNCSNTLGLIPQPPPPPPQKKKTQGK